MPTTTNTHSHDVRSYELDSYKHVNNGSYLAWYEDGRERFLRTEGRDYSYFPDKLGLYILVVNINCDFLNAAVSGDVVEVTTRLASTGRSSVVFRQSIRRASDGLLCSRARVVMVFADGKNNSAPIPDDFLVSHAVNENGDEWTDEERP